MKCKCGCELNYIFRVSGSVDTREHWETSCVECGNILKTEPVRYIEEGEEEEEDV